MTDSEAQIQTRVSEYLRSKGVLFSATTGGVAYKPHQLVNMRKRGYNNGVPDIIVFEPRGDSHGLCLELKSKTGRIRPAQRVFIADLKGRGYTATVAYSYEDAKEVIDNYLEQ